MFVGKKDEKMNFIILVGKSKWEKLEVLVVLINIKG